LADFKETEIRWVVKNLVGKICAKHKNWIDQIPLEILKIITACIGSKFGSNVEDILEGLSTEDKELADEIYMALVNKNVQIQKEKIVENNNAGS